MKQRIVLAYDGSPDTMNAISWLAGQHDADVVTLTLDLGDGMGLDGLRDLSLGRGAIRAHVLEVQEEFARDIILPAARGGTFGSAVTVGALVRPLLAKKLVDVARIEKASAVAYVSRGDDAAGLEGLIGALDPALSVIVIPAQASDARVRSPQRKSTLASSVAQVEISFAGGVPTAINGIGMRLPELLESLATIAAEHGIAGGGHAFAPAATVLHAAYAALASSRDGVVRLRLSDARCEVEAFSITA